MGTNIWVGDQSFTQAQIDVFEQFYRSEGRPVHREAIKGASIKCLCKRRLIVPPDADAFPDEQIFRLTAQGQTVLLDLVRSRRVGA